MTARDWLCAALLILVGLIVGSLINFGVIDPDHYRRPYNEEAWEQQEDEQNK